MSGSSEARFSRLGLVRAVRRRLAQADRALPTGGTLSDEASGVEAFTMRMTSFARTLRPVVSRRPRRLCPERSASKELRMLAQVRSEEGMRRGALFGNGIGQRDGGAHSCNGGREERCLDWKD